MKNLIIFKLLIISIITWADAQPINKQAPQNHTLSDKFMKYSTKAIPTDFEYFLNQKTKQVSYTLNLDAYGVYELLLTENNLISESLKNSATEKEFALNYQGTIEGKPESMVTLTVHKNYLGGYINTGERTIYFEPNFYINNTAKTNNNFIIYDEKDVVKTERGCSADKHHTKTQGEQIEQQYSSIKSAKMSCNSYNADIVLAATYDMYEKYGSNLKPHMQNILNGVTANYATAFNDKIGFSIVGYDIAESSADDKWSCYANGTAIIKGGILLDRFKAHMQSFNTNSNLHINKYDLASLWTYRNLEDDGDPNKKLGGIAFDSGVCRYNAKFSVINGQLNVTESIVAQSHEIGHNFGATHDKCGTKIMYKDVLPFGGWSRQSISEVNQFYPTAACLCTSQADFIDLIAYEGELTLNGETKMYTCDTNGDLGMQVINNGNATTGDFFVGIYLSEDNIITTDDQLISLKMVRSLEKGIVEILDFNDDYFNAQLKDFNIASGHYYRGYIIDIENDVTEMIESNNVGCVTSVNIITQKNNADAKLKLDWDDQSVCTNNKHAVKVKITNNYVNDDQIFKITVHDGSKLIHGSHNYTVKKRTNENISLAGIPIGRYQIKIQQKLGNNFKVVETRDYNFKPCGSANGVMPAEVNWNPSQSACDNNKKRSVAATVTNINENTRNYRILVYSKEGLVHASQKILLASNTSKFIRLSGIPAGQFHIVMENEGTEISKIPANIILPLNTKDEDKIFNYAIKSCNGTSVQDKFVVKTPICDSNNKRAISIDVTNGSTQSQHYNITITKPNGQFVHGSQETFIPTKEKRTLQLKGIPFGTYKVNVLSDCTTMYTINREFKTCGSGRNTLNPSQLEHYNYPNPFSGNTTISFNLPTKDEVSVFIYNASGKKVATLAEGHQYPQGLTQVNFNADNLPQGIYSYAIQTSTTTLANKMILLK